MSELAIRWGGKGRKPNSPIVASWVELPSESFWLCRILGSKEPQEVTVHLQQTGAFGQRGPRSHRQSYHHFQLARFCNVHRHDHRHHPHRHRRPQHCYLPLGAGKDLIEINRIQARIYDKLTRRGNMPLPRSSVRRDSLLGCGIVRSMERKGDVANVGL